MLRKEISKLEARVEREPNSTDAHRRFLQRLSEYEPSETLNRLRRLESSNQFIVQSPELIREYFIALAMKTSGIKYFDAASKFDRARQGAHEVDRIVNAIESINPAKSWWRQLLDRALPSFLILGLILFGMGFLVKTEIRAIPGSQKSSKLLTKETGVSFNDVRGCEEAKNDLIEIVQFLRDPQRFSKLGGSLPKGYLLVGPPGTGKTLLAKAVAGEAGVPFYYASGSEFDEMFVGLGAKRVRELFEEAKKNAPCIVFIDEFDSIGTSRKSFKFSENSQTINQLLTELDGFATSEGVMVLAATNFPESLDKALTRPGRFDRQVPVPLPDIRGRKSILDLYLSKITLDPSEDRDAVALTLSRGTPGSTGADLKNVVNVAAVDAAMEGLAHVSLRHLDEAKDKILMGAERKSALIPEDTRRLTAYHEGGHALVGLYTDGATPIYKATIMPRGSALGMVSMLPEDDRLSMTRKQMLAEIDVSMGGRVAEEMIFGEDNVTSGASSDLTKATLYAKDMVTKYGFSEKVGPINLSNYDSQDISPELKHLIEQEIKSITETSYARAKKMLTQRRDELELLANALLQYETLTLEEIRTVLRGEALNRQY